MQILKTATLALALTFPGVVVADDFKTMLKNAQVQGYVHGVFQAARAGVVWGLIDAGIEPVDAVKFTDSNCAGLTAKDMLRYVLSEKPNANLLDIAVTGTDFVRSRCSGFKTNS